MEITDSLLAGLDSANTLIINQNIGLIQANETVRAKEETVAFYKSQAEMRSKENRKLERGNLFWRFWAGVATAVSGLLIIKGL
jgi:anti-sigma-K factor RskA